MSNTKGNFSQAPGEVVAAALARNYVAVHIEQGVPVLDRDLNLLADLISARMQDIARRHIGNGVADTGDLAVQANGNANDFAVAAGTCLINGVEATLAAGTTYKTQTVPATASPPPPLPALTTPTATRLDTVYIDFWLDEIDDSPAPAGDPGLGNPADVGVRTSTRQAVSFCIRVLENAAAPSAVPSPVVGHVYYPLAQLRRQPNVDTLTSVQITDVRQKDLSMPVLEARIRALEGLLAPAVTSFSPEHVVAGQIAPITIVGKNFLVGTVQVLFGGAQGTIAWASTTNTSLVANVPITAAPGVWPLVVRNDVGMAVAVDPVTIDPGPPPPKFAPVPGTQFTPKHAAPTTSITLNGSNFTGVNRVTFNTPTPISAVLGRDLHTVSAIAIGVSVPAALPTGQTCTITVSIDNAPSMSATSTDLFTIDAGAPPPPPPIFAAPGSQFTPQTQSHGNKITLSGSNFGTGTATTRVTFNGTNTVIAAATDIISIAPTQIQVNVPASLTVAASPANTATVTVTVNGLSITSNDQLKVV